MTTQRKPMHAGEAVAEALREEGVERVYSVPGSHIHPIYDGLSRVESIRFVTSVSSLASRSRMCRSWRMRMGGSPANPVFVL